MTRAQAWLHDHWEALALIYAGFKIPGMVAGFSGGLASGLGGGAAGIVGAAAAGGVAGPWGAIIAAAAAMLAGVIVDAIQRGNAQGTHDQNMAATYGVGVRGGTIDAFIDAYERYGKASSNSERNQAARLVMAFGKNQDIASAAQLESAAGNWTADQRTRMARLLGTSSWSSRTSTGTSTN